MVGCRYVPGIYLIDIAGVLVSVDFMTFRVSYDTRVSLVRVFFQHTSPVTILLSLAKPIRILRYVATVHPFLSPGVDLERLPLYLGA